VNESIHVPQVGSPDPELNTSPITDEFDEDNDIIKQEVPGEPLCYFNETQYGNGQTVCSGDSRLRCNYGIWIREGSCDIDNP
jgi:hypothetical protein